MLDLVAASQQPRPTAGSISTSSNPHWDQDVLPPFILRATVPAGANPFGRTPADVQEVSSTIRLQNRLARVNIALLGRGTIRGSVVYRSVVVPVTHGEVWATSTLFNEAKRVELGSDGTFVLGGVP